MFGRVFSDGNIRGIFVADAETNDTVLEHTDTGGVFMASKNDGGG